MTPIHKVNQIAPMVQKVMLTLLDENVIDGQKHRDAIVYMGTYHGLGIVPIVTRLFDNRDIIEDSTTYLLQAATYFNLNTNFL